MLISYHRGQGSIVLRIKILNSSVSTGAGLTGLTSSSPGLIISTIADNEATATVYTQAASHIQTIVTLGTYSAPSASNCRFAEVDAINHKGVCEVQIADARYAVSNAKSLLVSISGATNCAETDAVIPLTDINPYDVNRGGVLALPDTACTTNASLLTSGTGTAQLKTTSGIIDLPAITANWLTAAGIAASALNGKGDWTVGDVRLLATGLSLIKDSSNTYDMKQLLIMIFEAAFYGQISGLPTGPAVLRNFANTLNRATIAFDSNNNRTGITINNAP